MNAHNWDIVIGENWRIPVSGPVEIGRQEFAEERLYEGIPREAGNVSGLPVPERTRLVLARGGENAISRNQALIEPLPDGRFRVTNISFSNQPILLPNRQLTSHQSDIVPAGTEIRFSDRQIRLGSRLNEETIQSLPIATSPPGLNTVTPPLTRLSVATSSLTLDSVLGWLGSAIEVLQAAATSDEFYQRAAQAIVDVADLDSGSVLLYRAGKWEMKAAAGESVSRPSDFVLSHVAEHKRTFWETPPDLTTGSLAGVSRVVAAPLLDPDRQVIGALYGSRRLDPRGVFRGPITEVHARVVELLARGVAAGLLRVSHELTTLTLRERFQQFFTPELANRLMADDSLLQEQEKQVTVLFCDIRGFSRISLRLGTRRTMAWIRDVMTALSRCVVETQGVLVDYIGDELMAMWGAPEEQPQHAALACQAALAMMATLPALNQKWASELKEDMSLGVGINTGQAQVGNTGSDFKFKYGPLGNTVNLASRIQGATKHFKTPMLVTESTLASIRELKDPRFQFSSRRLRTVRVNNIKDPVTVHELFASPDCHVAERIRCYEQALSAFLDRKFQEAAPRLGALRQQYPDDGPSLVLLSHAVQHMVEPPSSGTFDGIWDLPSK